MLFRSILHGDVELPGVFELTVQQHPDGIRMGEPAHGPRFPTEPGHEILSAGQFLMQNLDGHHPVHGRLLGLVHLAHAALADPLDDAELTEDLLADNSFRHDPGLYMLPLNRARNCER